ncbi:hypothetical protein KAI56_01440 [Candidatus Parcubacteria bacterium]|nr:hypothetical protein [Candidatus Parcubacteria bacterium]
MSKQKTILLLVILILLASNAFFAVKYFAAQEDLQQAKVVAEGKQTNKKVLNFTKLFIAQVLRADGEVDFETRLKLENAVRDLNDEKILAQWQKFVESETEAEAQEEVKNLLEISIGEIE